MRNVVLLDAVNPTHALSENVTLDLSVKMVVASIIHVFKLPAQMDPYVNKVDVLLIVVPK